MNTFKKLKVALLSLAVAVAVSFASSHASFANPNNVVVELADQHATSIVLTKGQSLWIVAHEQWVLDFDWPQGDSRFWNPPPQIEIKPTNASVFEFTVLADGLSQRDKAALGMAMDDVPLHVFNAKDPGQTDVTVTITPKVPGKQPYSETLHVTVK